MELVIKKGGNLFEKNWVYNKKEGEGKYKITKISKDSKLLLHYLFYPITLEEGFTIRDWFKLVVNYPVYQCLDPFMSSFLKEFSLAPSKNCIDKEIKKIEFKKMIVLDNFDTRPIKNKIYDCDISVWVCGLGKTKKISYGLSLTSPNTYLDTLIVLSKGLLSKTITNKNKETERNDYTYVNEDVKVTYSLYEFITSYIYEISFFGTPEQRKNKEKELNNMAEEIKSGKAKTVPFDPETLFKKKKKKRVKNDKRTTNKTV
jgi:hypothetical protein